MKIQIKQKKSQKINKNQNAQWKFHIFIDYLDFVRFNLYVHELFHIILSMLEICLIL